MLKQKITFSHKTQDLIRKFEATDFPVNDFSFWAWFKDEEIKSKRLELTKQQRFLLASLRASLLRDFCTENEIFVAEKENKPASLGKKCIFVLVVVTGTLDALFDGFRDINAFLGIFAAVPHLALILIGIAFAFLSAIVFYGFNLAAISSNLGINFKDSPSLIDSLLMQIEQIDLLTKFINKELGESKRLEELEELKDLALMLQCRYLALCEEGRKLNEALHNPWLKVTKNTITSVTGILFFTGGFFYGQSLVITIAALCGVALAATFWPVLVIGIVFGLGALAAYIWMERPGVERLVSKWAGLDQDKIDMLTDDTITSSQKEAIGNTINQVSTQISLNNCTVQSLQTRQTGQISHNNRNNYKSSGLFRSFSLNDLQQTTDLEFATDPESLSQMGL